MPDERGIVIRTFGNRAIVRTHRNGSCESCGSRSACFTLGGAMDVLDVEAFNDAGAEQGDTVVLRLSDGVFLGASATLYLIPVIGFVAGALGANALARSLGWNADLWSFLGGFALCGLAFALVRLALALSPRHRDALLPAIVSRSRTPLGQDTACGIGLPPARPE